MNAPFLIIGTGIAAFSAVEGILKAMPRASITLIGEDPTPFYSKPGLAYFLTGEIPESQLFPQSFQYLKQIKRINARVVAIHPGLHQVECADGRLLAYEKLLLATGSQASKINLPGNHLQNILNLDNLADARAIVKLARKVRTAVVVGGGITSLELVEGLRKQGVQVHYLIRGKHYWDNVLDEFESQVVEQQLQQEGVQIHFQTEIAEILGKTQVEGILTKDGRKIACQMLAVAIGVTPRKELAQTAALAIERGIMVNATFQTSNPDIFAAGDVAQVLDPLSGKSILDTLWSTSREQGFSAGLNMAGRITPYQKSTAFNVTRLANLTTTIAGMVGQPSQTDALFEIVRGDSETWRQIPEAIQTQNNFDVNHIRLMVGQNNLLGAVLMGDQTLSYPLRVLINHQADIRSIRDALLQPDAQLADILSAFWIVWRQRHAQR